MTVLEPHKFSGPHVGGNLSRARLRMECRGPSGRVLGRGSVQVHDKELVIQRLKLAIRSLRASFCTPSLSVAAAPGSAYSCHEPSGKRAKDGNSGGRRSTAAAVPEPWACMR